MARTVKTAEARQDEILDAAQRLFMTRGYADTPVQAIIDEIGIAKGTFYHHYPSKSSLLDALVRRMVDTSLASFHPIVDDPTLSAIDKLNTLYQTASTWKSERRDLLIDLRRALAAEANVVLLKRIELDSAELFVPMLGQVIAQGVVQGDFAVGQPLHAARIVHAISGNLFVSLRAALIDAHAPLPDLGEVRSEISAFHEAVERVLGAPTGSVHLVDAVDVEGWIHAMAARRSA